MNAALQASALIPSGPLAEGCRRRRSAKGWAALAVAALASVAAGVSVWLG